MFSSAVYAETPIIWEVPPSDTSYQYLTFLFGTVSPDLMCYSGGCSLLIPQIFAVFNQGLLAIGSIVMTFVLLTSTGSSANEGEFLGKKGASIWTPLRIMTGVSFLIPTQTGYSILQAFMMKVILMGVALANALYATIGNYVIDNDRTFARETVSAGGTALLLNNLVTLSSQIFAHELCYAAYALEQPFDSAMTDALGHGMSTSSTMLNGPTQLICDTTFFGYEYTTDQDSVSTGCDFTTPDTNLCGSWQYYYPSNDPNPSGTMSTLDTLTLNLRSAADSLTQSWYIDGTTSNPSMSTASSVQAERDIVQQSVLSGVSSMLSNNTADTSEDSSEFIADWMNFPMDFYGWIDRGSASPPSMGSTTIIRGLAMDDVGMSSGSETYKALKTKQKDVYNLFDETQISQASGGSSTVMKLQAPSMSGGPVGYMYSTLKSMVQGDSEPLISLAIFGQSMLKLAITMLLTSIILGGVMVVVSAICASVQNGFAMGMTSAFMGFITSLLMAFGFLIPMGVALGIYLPLIPGMTYCSGVIIWYMMVIETMVAGPIVALGMTSPGQETLGKSQGAILMLLNVFLRPSLMVMGMVFGAKMFDLFAIYFSNVMIQGFDFIGRKAGFDAWYGVVFFVFWFFYAFSIIGIAQRCYALIYILPDKVIVWISGQAGSSGQDIQQDLNTMKSAADKGGEAMKQEMSNVSSGLGKLSESVASIKSDPNKQ